MNNTFYFLRHAEAKIDSNITISNWSLSDKGEKQAQQRTEEGIFDEVEIIFSSNEKKAYQTAQPIAKKLGISITQVSELDELNRDKGNFLSSSDYEKSIEYCLKHKTESVNNWETSQHALGRFEKKINEINRQYKNKKILIVGHGFTINMYFAKLLGNLDKTYERLQKNNFADWGVIKNKMVIKDICKS